MGTAIKVNRGGGGKIEVLDTVVKEYLAEAETINANSFVEFVNTPQYSDSQSSFEGTNTYMYIDAIKVSDSVVLMAILYDSTSTNGVTLVVVSIEDGLVTFGSETSLYSFSTTYNYFKTIEIEEISDGYYVVLLGATGSTSEYAYNLNTIVVRYNNGVITKGSFQQITTGPKTGGTDVYRTVTKKIQNGKVLIVADVGAIDTYGLFATQSSSNPLVLTFSTYATLYTRSDAGVNDYKSFDIGLLPNNKFFFLVCNATSSLANYHKIVVYSYNLTNSTFTKLNESQVAPGNVYAYYINKGPFQLVQLTDTKYFVAGFYAVSNGASTNTTAISTFCWVMEFDDSNNLFTIGKLKNIDMKLQNINQSPNHNGRPEIFKKLSDKEVMFATRLYEKNYSTTTWNIGILYISNLDFYLAGLTSMPSSFTTSQAGYAMYSRIIPILDRKLLFLNMYSQKNLYAKTISFPELKISKSQNYIAGLLTSKATTTQKGKVIVSND